MRATQRTNVDLVPSGPGRHRLCAHLATAWCLVFACAHLYWAVGGRAGFVAATGSLKLLDQPFFVVIGLWGVAIVCIVGALACLATVLSFGRRVPPRLLLTVLWVGAAALTLRAVTAGLQDALLEAGVLHTTADFDWSVVHWRLAVWTPWFAIGAVLFALTAAGRPQRNTR
ncbi:DUF3995 domain-containing protein [Tsukamurella sputi]|uniref:DUF3995 domain-containing protein n=1 Tax=Tsukamurella sputi TaxID=2591848 RepID=A0A5C5RKT6_9ACTN|nr:DUF3995 domain-containing protein [Tsukamurella sputi]TWS23577.1 DUF3995 domain-containing protein [Tsukamurella sputi]